MRDCLILRTSPKNVRLRTDSERSAHGETERGGRLEIIQATRVVLNQIDLRLDLILKNRGIESRSQKVDFALLDKRRLCDDRLVQTVQVIRVVDSERGLHNR